MATIGIKSLVGGMNDFVSPEFLPETQYARGVNIINRGGTIQSAPRVLDIATLPSGRFQGMFSYRQSQYCAVAGQVYPVEDGVVGAAVSGVSFSPIARQLYATETFDYLILSDGIGNVGVVGDVDNRMSGESEMTNIGLLCFGQGRVFFTDTARRTLMAGDIYVPGEPDSLLKLTEMTFLNESFEIVQPAAFGKINAMNFIRNSDSGSGLGQLVVFSDGGVNAYNVYLPRASDAATQTKGWLDSQIGQQLFRHGGCGGPRTTIQINNDLFYREASGLTTLRTANTNVSNSIRALPISVPISNLLSRDALWTLEFASCAANDNRIWYTHGLRCDRTRDGSFTYTGDYYFDSLVSLDLASFYADGEASMTFDGFVTGHKYLQVFSGNYRGRNTTFVVRKGPNDSNILCVLSGSDVTNRPRSRVYTRRMAFANPLVFSKLKFSELWFEDIKTDLDVAVYYRSESGLWNQGGTASFNVPQNTASLYDVLPQSRDKLRLSLYTSTCDAITRAAANRGGQFQLCIEFTGVAKLSRVRFESDEGVSGDFGELLPCDVDAGTTLTADDVPVTLYDYDHLQEVL